MNPIQTSLHGLQEKLVAFVKKFQHLEKEHVQLQQKLEQKEKEVIQLQEQLKGLQGQMAGALLQNGSMDSTQKEKLAHQIDNYIKEIDHYIQQLQP